MYLELQMDNHFVVGDQVVCIEEDWEIYEGEEHLIFPKKGNIYTIREMIMGDHVHFGEHLFLNFVEIVNPDNWRGEIMFVAFCFRPVKKTSIDVFNAILKKIP